MRAEGFVRAPLPSLLSLQGEMGAVRAQRGRMRDTGTGAVISVPVNVPRSRCHLQRCPGSAELRCPHPETLRSQTSGRGPERASCPNGAEGTQRAEPRAAKVPAAPRRPRGAAMSAQSRRVPTAVRRPRRAAMSPHSRALAGALCGRSSPAHPPPAPTRLQRPESRWFPWQQAR